MGHRMVTLKVMHHERLKNKENLMCTHALLSQARSQNCLGLVYTASSLSGKIEADFLGDVILWATPTPLWSLYTVLYDTLVCQ